MGKTRSSRDGGDITAAKNCANWTKQRRRIKVNNRLEIEILWKLQSDASFYSSSIFGFLCSQRVGDNLFSLSWPIYKFANFSSALNFFWSFGDVVEAHCHRPLYLLFSFFSRHILLVTRGGTVTFLINVMYIVQLDIILRAYFSFIRHIKKK